MNYQIMPMGDIWSDGMLSVPKKVVNDYIKMASKYQLQALLIILANNGTITSQELAKSLGLTQEDVDNILDFWVNEGVLVSDANCSTKSIVAHNSEQNECVKKEDDNPIKIMNKLVVESKKEQNKENAPKAYESMTMPSYTPQDIVRMCNESEELTELMRNAQEVMGKSLSHAEQDMLMNMVTYYGLPVAVVLMILHYYKSEKEKGKAIGVAYICAMAKNWAEEGITDCKSAEEKLKDIESSDRIWNEIITMSGIRHRTPTPKQRNMISEWCESFSMEMIALACDAMKENAEKPTLNYVDKVLKNWKKKNILTPSDVENDKLSFAKAKQDKQDTDKIQGKASYNIDELQKKAMLNDKFDI